MVSNFRDAHVTPVTNLFCDPPLILTHKISKYGILVEIPTKRHIVTVHRRVESNYSNIHNNQGKKNNLVCTGDGGCRFPNRKLTSTLFIIVPISRYTVLRYI